MKKIIFLLLILIPMACCGQGTWNTRQDFDEGIQIVGGITVDNIYVSAGDTIISIAGHDFLLSDIRLKLNVADTAAMLATYINKADTASMLLTYINKADTASMLSNYAELSEVIVPADTASMLSNYAELSEVILPADTAAMLTNYALLLEIDHDAIINTHNLTTDINHDALTNFAENEHRIWEITGAEDVHVDRISETSVTQHEAAIDHDQLDNFVLAEHNVLAAGSGIVIGGGGGSDIIWGGAITGSTTITGTEVNDLNFSFTDASDRSAIFRFDAADGLTMRAYTGDDHTGDLSVMGVDSNKVLMAQYDGAAIKSIMIDTTGMYITDDDEGIGLQYSDDYSPGYTNRSPPDKEYVDIHLGGQNLNSTVYSPGLSEHGGIITYDSTGYATGTDQYVITDVVEVGQAAGFVIEDCDTVLFSNTSQTTTVTLPVGAVISDIFVYVATTFDGSGTDLLDIGISGSGNRYEDNLDLAVGASFPTMTLTNIRDRTAGSTNITFQYFDNNADASAGEAYVYVRYAIH